MSTTGGYPPRPEPTGYPEPYYGPGWHPAPPPREPLALWSLITGVLGLGPVALGLALGARRRIARHGRRGRGLAVAGVVLGIVGTLGVGGVTVVAALDAAAHRPLPPDVAGPRRAHAVQLVTGNCLATLPADGPVDTVDVVPCDGPHTARVVTEYDFAAGSSWPGQDTADAAVARACVLTPDEVAAGATAVTWAPTREGWARGDRTGLCLAVTPGAADE